MKPIKVIILNSKLAPYTLGKNCDPSWLAILLRELANTNAEIRYEACGACCELGDEQAVTYLIELVNDSDTEVVQLAAIRALGKIGGIEAEECLKRCLNGSSELVQQTAEKALNELGAEEDPLSLKFNTFDT